MHALEGHATIREEVMSQPAPKHEVNLEPLTPEQRAAVEAWESAGRPEQPEVRALRKMIRGEPMTDEERATLTRVGRKPAPGPTFSHEQVQALLAERARSGE
jgi:hypothetical protein